MFEGLKVLAASPTKLNRMASDQESDNNSLGSPSPFKNMKKRTIFIGIAGGTASGKTTVLSPFSLLWAAKKALSIAFAFLLS